MNKPITEVATEGSRTRKKIPRGVIIALCVFPAVVVALFYALRPMQGTMDWVCAYISLPVRKFFGRIFSIYPIALMEVLSTTAGIFLIYYITKAIRDSSRRREKWKLLGKRALWFLVAVCYIYGAFCWLWSSGYHATGFASKNGLRGAGVNVPDLIAVTKLFANRAGELSVQLERDEENNLILNRREMFEESRYIYEKMAKQFPSLEGPVYAPKPMYMYSWLMTITGYSGMYFAFTGEAMINTQLHAAYMPAVVAHEHAHQLGVFSEEEANFAGILACLMSENPVFEYAGYLTGLGYLLNALAAADREECAKILSGLKYEVKLDRFQNYEFWAEATVSNTGIDWLDRILTSLKEKSNAAVDNAYDGYLKSQNQELGVKSYGACVDLLVEYFAARTFSAENVSPTVRYTLRSSIG